MDTEQENPVKIAIKLELDGMDFYKKAADNTNNPLGKKIFLSLIEDEKAHLRALEMIFKGVSFNLIGEMFRGSNPKKRLQTVFSEAGEDIADEMRKADPDDLKALELAMDMEKRGYDYYMEVSNNSDNKEVKTLFKILAGEENAHYSILQNSHTYLSDTGNWFLWEEKGIIDGG